MTSKSWAVKRCGAFCQVTKCALGENGRPDDPQDDVGWRQSRVVMWPSGQSLHAYALYWAIGFSSKGLYLHTTIDVCSNSGCRFGLLYFCNTLIIANTTELSDLALNLFLFNLIPPTSVCLVKQALLIWLICDEPMFRHSLPDQL